MKQTIKLILVIIVLLFSQNTECYEDKQILNPLGCADTSFIGGKTVILDDDAVNIIRCQVIGNSNYLVNFNIRSRSTQFHIYFTTGIKCETADMDYDDKIIANWDEDPTKARTNLEFYAERDDSHIFSGKTSQRSVAITNYVVTPSTENLWFCFMIKDDDFRRNTEHSVTIEYLFEPEASIWSNNIVYSKPVQHIAIKGVGLDKDTILNRPISKCCRIVTNKDNKDSNGGKKLECNFADIDENGAEGTVKFKYPVMDEGFIQVSIGVMTGESHCPQNWTTVGKVEGFNIMNLLNSKYGILIIAGCAVVILVLCWCIQSWQKRRMIKMIMQPRK